MSIVEFGIFKINARFHNEFKIYFNVKVGFDFKVYFSFKIAFHNEVKVKILRL